MKDFKYKEIIPYALSLLLAAGVIYFKDNLEYAKILVIAAVVILLAPIIVKLVLRYVIAEAFSLVSTKGMKIHYSGNRDIAKSIYHDAKSNGGTVISTHIFQNRVKPEDDFAFKAFNSGLDNHVNFKRALLFNNKLEEQNWLKQFYSIEDNHLDFTAYVWKNIDFTNNNAMISLIPRFNFLLYKDLNDKNYRILLGFERIRTRDNFLTKRLNFGISFTSKHVFDALSKYFDNIVRHPEIEKITDKFSLQEYQYDFIHSPSEQFIIKELIELAYTEKSVLHLGAFGKTAILLKNLNRIKGKINHQSDIDLLFVIQESKDKFKKKIIERFEKFSFQTQIIFGDDEDYFYEFRKPSSVLVDIEIFEKDSTFYKINQLLGYSIFHHYFNLFTVAGKTLDGLIFIPKNPIKLVDRLSLLIDNRKSITEFIDKLNSCQENKIDLRRVATINTINFNWALTGYRCDDVETALDYLHYSKIIDDNDNNYIMTLLNLSENELKSNYNDNKLRLVAILKKLKKKSLDCK